MFNWNNSNFSLNFNVVQCRCCEEGTKVLWEVRQLIQYQDRLWPQSRPHICTFIKHTRFYMYVITNLFLTRVCVLLTYAKNTTKYKITLCFTILMAVSLSKRNRFLQRVQCSLCKRCISYGNSVRPSVRLSVRLSVCPSVRYTPVLCQNDGT